MLGDYTPFVQGHVALNPPTESYAEAAFRPKSPLCEQAWRAPIQYLKPGPAPHDDPGPAGDQTDIELGLWVSGEGFSHSELSALYPARKDGDRGSILPC